MGAFYSSISPSTDLEARERKAEAATEAEDFKITRTLEEEVRHKPSWCTRAWGTWV